MIKATKKKVPNWISKLQGGVHINTSRCCYREHFGGSVPVCRGSRGVVRRLEAEASELGVDAAGEDEGEHAEVAEERPDGVAERGWPVALHEEVAVPRHAVTQDGRGEEWAARRRRPRGARRRARRACRGSATAGCRAWSAGSGRTPRTPPCYRTHGSPPPPARPSPSRAGCLVLVAASETCTYTHPATHPREGDFFLWKKRQSLIVNSAGASLNRGGWRRSRSGRMARRSKEFAGSQEHAPDNTTMSTRTCAGILTRD